MAKADALITTRGVKRTHALVLACAMILSLTFSFVSPTSARAAELYPGSLANFTWSLFRANGTEPTRDQGLDPGDYIDGISSGTNIYTVLNFNLVAPPGGFFANDTITIPFMRGGNITSFLSAPEPLLAADGTAIGTWEIVSGPNLIIRLNTVAEAHSVFYNVNIQTAPNMSVAVPVGSPAQVQTWTTGGVAHLYRINARVANLVTVPSQTKTTQVISNNQITWYIRDSRDLLNRLTTSRGTAFPDITSIIIEDDFPASSGVTGVSLTRADVRVPYIMSDTDWRAAYIANNGPVTNTAQLSRFTQVMQNPGEPYTDFRARLNTFQYGIYQTGDGSFRFVLNLGNPQDPAYPLRYSMLWPDLRQSLINSTENGYSMSEAEADIIADALGDSNVVHGNVVSWAFSLRADYTQVVVPTLKTNTVSTERIENGVPSTSTATGSGTMNPGSSITTPDPESATLIKYDSVSGAAIAGVTFRLERSTGTNAGPWISTAYGPNGNGTFTTAADGTVNTGALALGWYRFVEITPPAGHIMPNNAFTSDPIGAVGANTGVFEIVGLGGGIIAYVANEPVGYTVNYDLDGGTINRSTTYPPRTDVSWNTTGNLPSDSPTKDGYEFIGWAVLDSGEQNTKEGRAVTNSTSYADMADATQANEADASRRQVTIVTQWRGTAIPELHKEVINLDSTDGLTRVGDRLRYTISVSNTGTAVWTPGVITDVLPSGVDFISVETAGFGISAQEVSHIVTIATDDIPQGTLSAAIAHITVVVNESAKGATISNTVTAEDEEAGEDSADIDVEDEGAAPIIPPPPPPVYPINPQDPTLPGPGEGGGSGSGGKGLPKVGDGTSGMFTLLPLIMSVALTQLGLRAARRRQRSER